MLALYRKKPVIITALKYDGSTESIAAVSAFVGRVLRVKQDKLIIETLEGDMEATVGDWIIQGVQGEFYPCKDDIFHKTYEWVEDVSA